MLQQMGSHHVKETTDFRVLEISSSRVDSCSAFRTSKDACYEVGFVPFLPKRT